MQRPALVTVALSVSIAAFVACGSFGTDSSRPNESDASTEAAASDTGTGPDGSLPGEGGGPSFCDTQAGAFFCDDFEHGSPDAGFRWDTVNTTDGTLVVIDNAGRDESRALRVTITEPDGANPRSAALSKAITGVPSPSSLPPSRYELSFDFRVEKTSFFHATLGMLHLTNTTGGAFENGARVFGMASFDAMRDPQAGPALPFDTAWHRAVVTVDLKGMDTTATVAIDGSEVENYVQALDAKFAMAQIGLFYAPGVAGAEATAFIDNVVVRVPTQ